MNALVRLTNPVAGLSSLIDEFFADNALFARSDRDITYSSWPRVDIVEEDGLYRIFADIPGMEKGDIKVSVEEGTLTISGEKKGAKREEKKDRYYHLERTYGAFSRSFYLPDNVDPESIEAHHKNGVLEVTLKKNARTAPKAIEVKVE